jgi:hypothetical protein
MTLRTRVSVFLPLLAVLAAAMPAARAADTPVASTDVAQEWQRFLATTNGDVALVKYAVLDKLSRDDGSPDPEACRTEAAALDEAIAAVPVGLALEYAAYRCREALGDANGAERHLDRFGALAKYALSQASDDPLAPPIRVAVLADVYALIAASDLEERYECSTSPSPGVTCPCTSPSGTSGQKANASCASISPTRSPVSSAPIPARRTRCTGCSCARTSCAR